MIPHSLTVKQIKCQTSPVFKNSHNGNQVREKNEIQRISIDKDELSEYQ